MRFLQTAQYTGRETDNTSTSKRGIIFISVIAEMPTFTNEDYAVIVLTHGRTNCVSRVATFTSPSDVKEKQTA